MGRPAHVIEVKVQEPAWTEYPAVVEHLQRKHHTGVFIRIHSAADGFADLCEPHLLGVWTDDVISLSIHTAKSKKHFERGHSEEFVQVHIPRDVVCDRLSSETKDAEFLLGLRKDLPTLGRNGSKAQYRAAFEFSTALTGVPVLRVAVREVFMPTQGLVSESMEVGNRCHSQEVERPSSDRPKNRSGELCLPVPTSSHSVPRGDSSSESDGRLFQLHLEALERTNVRLCKQLGMRPELQPSVEQEVRAHQVQLMKAQSENERIKTELSSVQMQLEACMALEEVESDTPAAQEDAEQQRALSAEIQRISARNVEIIGQYDDEVKMLEDDLVAVRRKHLALGCWGDGHRDELMRINRDCDNMEISLSQGRESNVREEKTNLDLELYVARQELDRLKERLQGHVLPLKLPSTQVLQDEAQSLREKLAHAQQKETFSQTAMQQVTDQLRREIEKKKEALENMREENKQGELDLEALRSSDLQQEFEDQQQRKKQLEHEVSRAFLRIQSCNEMIERLKKENDDIRDRVRDLPQVAGAVPERRASRTDVELVDLVASLEVQLREAKANEDLLNSEHGRAAKERSAMLFEVERMENELHREAWRSNPKTSLSLI